MNKKTPAGKGLRGEAGRGMAMFRFSKNMVTATVASRVSDCLNRRANARDDCGGNGGDGGDCEEHVSVGGRLH